MTELKTLKDLKFINNPNPICKTINSELRQEAIEHIKSQNPFVVFDLDHWKRFFNITEEDLK